MTDTDPTLARPEGLPPKPDVTHVQIDPKIIAEAARRLGESTVSEPVVQKKSFLTKIVEGLQDRWVGWSWKKMRGGVAKRVIAVSAAAITNAVFHGQFSTACVKIVAALNNWVFVDQPLPVDEVGFTTAVVGALTVVFDQLFKAIDFQIQRRKATV